VDSSFKSIEEENNKKESETIPEDLDVDNHMSVPSKIKSMTVTAKNAFTV